MISPRRLLVGAAAAVVAPWHLEGERLKRLVEPTPAERSRGAGGGADPAVRAARGAIRVLSRLPFSPWRNTCLYRAVAGCLAVRWLGGEAVVRIGTRRDPETGAIVAHAWIDGTPDEPAADAGYQMLEARG